MSSQGPELEDDTTELEEVAAAELLFPEEADADELPVVDDETPADELDAALLEDVPAALLDEDAPLEEDAAALLEEERALEEDVPTLLEEEGALAEVEPGALDDVVAALLLEEVCGGATHAPSRHTVGMRQSASAVHTVLAARQELSTHW